MSTSAEFSAREVIVAPGGEEVIHLTIRNLGPSPEVYALVTTGLAQGWLHVEPATVALPPGSFETVSVAVRPPRSWAVPAGPNPFSVRVVPHSGIDEVAVADAIATVLAFDERLLHLAQPVQRSRRRAEYDVVIENHGNAHASCRLTVADATRRVKGKFEPPSIGVDPGMTQPCRLVVTARRRRWRRSRSLPFVVQAAQDGHPTIEVGGTLLQDPMIAARSYGRLALLGITAGAVVAGWFGVVKPAIDDAAERAVARAGAAPVTVPVTEVDAGQGDVADPAGTTLAPVIAAGAATPSNPVSSTATAFDTRLQATAAIGEQGTAAYTVAAGERLRITDVLLQNPSRDAGRLTLLRNSEIVYDASLDNITDYAIGLLGALVFEPGQTVTLQLTCQGIGDPTGTACNVGATLVGTLEPVS